MFFTGDASSRRKVELRGRSTKESDRQALINKAKDDRERRMLNRQKNNSALHIQRCFRGKREVAAMKKHFRQDFVQSFGENSERAARDAFQPASKYLTTFFYFFTNPDDIPRLFGVCRLFRQLLSQNGGDVSAVFTSGDYSTYRGAVNYRLKRLASHCLYTLHYLRFAIKNELLSSMSSQSNSNSVLLVETLLALVRDDCPWTGAVTEHLMRNHSFALLRDLLLTVEVKNAAASSGTVSFLENLVYRLCLQEIKLAESFKLPWSCSYIVQILSVPFLWQRLPLLKQVGVKGGLWRNAISQSALSLLRMRASLPLHQDFPSDVCFLGNILEASALALAQDDCKVELATDFAKVCSYMIRSVPTSYLRPPEAEHDDEDDEMLTEEKERSVPIPALRDQLQHAADPDVLKYLVRISFSSPYLQSASNASAIGALCGFVYAALSVDRTSVAVLMSLTYIAPIISPLWQYIKFCHQNATWPAIEFPGGEFRDGPTPDVLGWMLPLTVFCAVLEHLLITTDNEEFYEKQKIMSMDDAQQLVHVLKEVLWQVLWVLPSRPSSTAPELFSYQGMRQTFVKYGARVLTELHDRNSKRQFAPAHAFHAREAIEELFFQQAESENTKARELLKRVPFLIPFTSRVRIYTAQLTAARQASERHMFPRVRVKVQRDRIIEDSFDQFKQLSEDDMRATIRVSFVNDFGLEEAGVDGGGLFKDFMENVTKAAFDIQYGLFKETADHLLYPNPASHLVHDDHLQYFEFLGRILGKAMFEGILVDIPFATFFLSKLKKKPNYLHDLPSLDPVLYKNLLFLKNNTELSQLGLYFAIGDDEYGQQRETPLLPGGKDMPVTEENVFRYIHLVANHRLNHQIRNQSSHFLRGFQQLISTEWIDMFNEHELQILISGSRDVLNVDDLRMNVNYGGGYYENHPVIEMFWEVVKTLEADLQRKLLKFVTGCSRGPLLGFRYLEPQFCIQKTAPDDAGGEVLDRLPTAATCMNLLKLPPYKSKATLRDKLLYAITSGAGFDLS